MKWKGEPRVPITAQCLMAQLIALIPNPNPNRNPNP